MNNKIDIGNCKLCGSLFSSDTIEIPDWFNSSKKCFYFICPNCKSLELKKDIENIDYEDSPQNFARKKDSKLVRVIKSTISYTHKINYNKIINASGKKKNKGQLLEIGCGRGHLLKLAEEEGWIVTGLEPQYSKYTEAKNNVNGEIYNSTLESVNFTYKYDVIILWHVFEHLENLGELLNKTKRILADDGVIIIGVPNISSLQYKIFSNNWFHLCAPAHNFQFSQKGILSLMNQSNMASYTAKHFDLIVSITGWFFSLQNLLIKPNNYYWHYLQKTATLEKNKKNINFVKFILTIPIIITFTVLGSLLDFLFGPRANLTIVVKHN